MSKKMNYVEKIETKGSDYRRVETNIYKTGSSYRVRVNGMSENTTSLKAARELKKKLKSGHYNTKIW